MPHSVIKIQINRYKTFQENKITIVTTKSGITIFQKGGIRTAVW